MWWLSTFRLGDGQVAATAADKMSVTRGGGGYWASHLPASTALPRALSRTHSTAQGDRQSRRTPLFSMPQTLSLWVLPSLPRAFLS